MTLGFIGFGEAAYCMCKGFRGEGLTDIIAYDAMQQDEKHGPLVHRRAAETATPLLQSAEDVAAQADVLFVAVPCMYCVSVAERVAGSLRAGTIYADVSASSPEEMQQAWAALKDKNVYFADVALLGSVPPDQHRVPILASGNGADRFRDTMTPYGMRIESIAGEPGQASAVKLIRSIYMKGVSAIMLEMMCAAEAYGVTDLVLDSLSRSMDPIPLASHLNRLITGMAVHSRRRSAELGSSVELQEKAGLEHLMSSAAQKTHDAVVQAGLCDRYAGERPKDWHEVVQEMNRLTKGKPPAQS